MKSPRLLVTYRVGAAPDEIEARARALAAEQSVEMTVDAIRDPRVLAEVVSTVESIRPAGDAFEVTLGLAAETTGHEASQLVNMLFGNCSLQPEVALLDVAFPPGYASAFPGPALGIAGLREKVGAPSRALTCTALKPQGSTVAHLAHLAGTFARAGIDVVKDDHGLANQSYSPFAERVPACSAPSPRPTARPAAGRSTRPLFSAGRGRSRSRRGSPGLRRGHGARGADARRAARLRRNAARVRPGAARASGLCRRGARGARRCSSASSSACSARTRRSSPTTAAGSATAARPAWHRRAPRASRGRASRPSLPVPAGGMSVERVPEMIADYGIDTMLLIGGGLLGGRCIAGAEPRSSSRRVTEASSPVRA